MKRGTVLAALTLTGALLAPTAMSAPAAEAAVSVTQVTKQLTRVTLKVAKKNNRPYLTVTGNAVAATKKTPLRIKDATSGKTVRTCTVVKKCNTYLGTSVYQIYATWGKRKTGVYRVPQAAIQQTQATLPGLLRQDAQSAKTTLQALPKDPAGQLSDAAKKQYSAADIRKALPTGTVITPDTSTWTEQIGYGTGTMRVSIKRPGQTAQRYLALMVQDEIGNWKFLTTLEVK